jgi:hypothetical protein
VCCEQCAAAIYNHNLSHVVRGALLNAEIKHTLHAFVLCVLCMLCVLCVLGTRVSSEESRQEYNPNLSLPAMSAVPLYAAVHAAVCGHCLAHIRQTRRGDSVQMGDG